MTCNDKCIHFPVCEQKKYDFANIDECQYYEEKRPHGEWIPMITIDDYGEEVLGYKCKNCGWIKPHDKMPFCENCGADMRKRGDTE